MCVFVDSMPNYDGNIYLVVKIVLWDMILCQNKKKLVDDFLAHLSRVVNQRGIVPLGLVLDSLLRRRRERVDFLWLFLSGYGSGLSKGKFFSTVVFKLI